MLKLRIYEPLLQTTKQMTASKLGMYTCLDLCRLTGAAPSSVKSLISQALLFPILISDKNRMLFSSGAIVTLKNLMKLREEGVDFKKLRKII